MQVIFEGYTHIFKKEKSCGKRSLANFHQTSQKTVFQLRNFDYICSPFPREMQQATLAQSVEQRIRNAQVVSSSLMSGSGKREVQIRTSRFSFTIFYDPFRSCFGIIPLFSYMAFPAIFIFVIGHVATATLPLPKPKLSRIIRIIKFGNHSKTASQSAMNQLILFHRAEYRFNYCRKSVQEKPLWCTNSPQTAIWYNR